MRTSPDSTYKIYDALFALEEGVITPADSSMAWDGTAYPFAAWNKDQDLDTAMRASVNWYFEKIDRQLGSPVIRDYLHRIGYGNETIPAYITTGSSPYWLQSSLKISPVEQVQLLAALYDNRPGFAVNIQGSSGTAGSKAAGIAKAVLSALAGSDSSFSSTELDRYLNVPSANG